MIDDIIDTTVAGLQEYIVDSVMFTNATFLKNFGPWTVGQTVACIDFNYTKGKVVEYDVNQDIVTSCNIKLSVDTTK